VHWLLKEFNTIVLVSTLCFKILQIFIQVFKTLVKTLVDHRRSSYMFRIACIHHQGVYIVLGWYLIIIIIVYCYVQYFHFKQYTLAHNDNFEYVIYTMEYPLSGPDCRLIRATSPTIQYGWPMNEGLLYLNIRRFCGVRLRLLRYCKRQGYWYCT
jgi:hypothetical protein